MMKILLGLSITVNLVLAWFLINKKPEVVERERLIIESHADAANQEPVSTKASAPAPVIKEEKKKNEPAQVDFVNADFTEINEKIETDRMDFMTETLGMSEEKIAQHNKLREEFYKKTTDFWKKDPMRELSFKDRRKMIDIEEQFHAKLEKLHGKKNWEKFQKFREDYNNRGHKKQMEDGVPFLYMGL